MVSILFALILLGVLLYVLTLIPMDATILTLIRVVVILFAVIWVARSMGVHLPF